MRIGGIIPIHSIWCNILLIRWGLSCGFGNVDTWGIKHLNFKNLNWFTRWRLQFYSPGNRIAPFDCWRWCQGGNLEVEEKECWGIYLVFCRYFPVYSQSNCHQLSGYSKESKMEFWSDICKNMNWVNKGTASYYYVTWACFILFLSWLLVLLHSIRFRLAMDMYCRY